MAASAYHVISKEVENHINSQNWIFRRTCMQKQSTLTKYWNYNIFIPILYSYFRCTGRLFFRCALFVACYSIIRASWESKKGIMIELQKKYIHPFWQHAILSISFLLLSLSTPIPFSSDLLAEWPLYRYLVRSGILCDDIMTEQLKIWKYLAI